MPWRRNFEQDISWIERHLFDGHGRDAKAYTRYLIALALTGCAFAIRLVIAPEDGGIQYVTFFPATALAAIIAGFRAGMLSAVLGAGLACYFFWPPYRAFTFDFAGQVVLSNGVFLIDALLVSGAIEAMHRFYNRFGLVQSDLALAARAIESTSEGIMVTDRNGTIISVNPAFTDITGYSWDEAVGKKPNLLRSQHQAPDFYHDLWRELEEKGRWQGEIWNRRKSGEAYLQWLTINQVHIANSDESRYIGVFHDVTEQRQKDERIRHLAYHDPLTDLPNRSLIQDRIEHALARCHRNGSRGAVIFADLDRFKAINDELGHAAGDLLLKEMAGRIKQRIREMDTLARVGGDEFVILLEDLAAANDCSQFAQDIIDAVLQPMTLRGQEIRVGISLGIAFYPEDGQDLAELLKHADVAMYAAKSAGRNTFRYFQQDMLDGVKERLTLESELRKAIASDELVLHYQPKIELATGRTAAVEALVRWHHPTRGMVPPGDFIPIAEECGLIIDLGDWVLREAVQQLATWQQQGIRIKIAVNVTARQLEKGGLAQRIQELLTRRAVAAKYLEIEVTESMVIEQTDMAVATLQELRNLGLSIAMDDFGTGYSSLAYLRKLPLDVIKIDRSFVMHSDENEQDSQIVKTIIALGHVLNLTVVAEGVETAAQVELLRTLGCERGQGYFFSKPLPAEHLEAWLKRENPAYAP